MCFDVTSIDLDHVEGLPFCGRLPGSANPIGLALLFVRTCTGGATVILSSLSNWCEPCVERGALVQDTDGVLARSSTLA